MLLSGLQAMHISHIPLPSFICLNRLYRDHPLRMERSPIEAPEFQASYVPTHLLPPPFPSQSCMPGLPAAHVVLLCYVVTELCQVLSI